MRYTICALIIITAFSCEEPYTIEEQQVDSELVIEGLITNEPKNHLVKISTTAGFYTIGSTPAISNASVEVEDNEGNIFLFTEDPNSPGHYYSEVFTGVVHRTYQLRVNANGKKYQAEETLPPVTSIDSLSYFLDEREREYRQKHEDDEPDRYYEVQFFTKEPPESVDFYLFKFYRDGMLINGNGEDVYYSDDEFLQENIDGVAFNDWYKLGELAKIEMYSLSREAYLYYRDVELALNNDGGLFSPLPTNPRTNLSNGAIGYFQVSAIASDSIRIE